MRVTQLLSLSAGAALLLLAAVPAGAIERDDHPTSGTDTGAPPVEDELSTTYSSIGLQKLAFKIPNTDVKDAVNLDFTMIGFRIPPAPWFAIELNLGFTMIPGQINAAGGSGSSGNCITTNPNFPVGCNPGAPSSTGGQADLSATTAGVFAVVRSTGPVFAMGKIGYRYLTTNIDGFPPDRSGNAYGLGIGYRWNKKGSYAEFGYTHYNSDISALGFSLSYSYDRR